MEQEFKKIKLDNINIFSIFWYIVMVVFSITIAIRSKNLAWITIAMLWGDLAITEYCNAKIKKMKDYNLELKDKIIKSLMNELNEKTYEKINNLKNGGSNNE